MGQIGDEVEERCYDALHRSNEQHRISQAVQSLAHKMKGRMLANIDRKSGWDDRGSFTDEDLKKKLLAAFVDGDWVSVANFSMMADKRGL